MKTYNTEEAAKILHYNKVYLAQKIKKGEIKAVKIGGKWIITQETIDKLLGLK